jgi:hypothetical protein
MPRRKEPRIPDAILAQLLAGADPKTVFDPNGLLDELKKALAERALNAEMDHHLTGDRGTGNTPRSTPFARGSRSASSWTGARARSASPSRRRRGTASPWAAWPFRRGACWPCRWWALSGPQAHPPGFVYHRRCAWTDSARAAGSVARAARETRLKAFTQ